MWPRVLKYWRNLACLLALTTIVGGVTTAYFVVRRELSGHTDVLFEGDYSRSGYEIGTALRVDRSGMFGGKVRYYVIVVRDSSGQTIDTLYEWPGAYPDAPDCLTFVAITRNSLTYDIPY